MADIITLAGTFKSELDLKSYCNTQYNTIKSLSEENQQLKEKVKHLENLLVAKPSSLEISPEQHLVEMQLQMLKDRGLKSELSVDDTTRLEKLIKILKIIKETSSKKPTGIPSDINWSDIMKSAKSPIKSDDTE